jgi:hypothetical protein
MKNEKGPIDPRFMLKMKRKLDFASKKGGCNDLTQSWRIPCRESHCTAGVETEEGEKISTRARRRR